MESKGYVIISISFDQNASKIKEFEVEDSAQAKAYIKTLSSSSFIDDFFVIRGNNLEVEWF